MEAVGSFILILEGIAFATLLVITVFLIFRRSKIKKKENFEEREN